MGELTVAERDAAHGLLKVVLSPMGHQKVLDIVAADQMPDDRVPRGPSLLVEHAPQDNQGGCKLHVHPVMRDLGNDDAKQLV